MSDVGFKSLSLHQFKEKPHGFQWGFSFLDLTLQASFILKTWAFSPQRRQNGSPRRDHKNANLEINSPFSAPKTLKRQPPPTPSHPVFMLRGFQSARLRATSLTLSKENPISPKDHFTEMIFLTSAVPKSRSIATARIL